MLFVEDQHMHNLWDATQLERARYLKIALFFYILLFFFFFPIRIQSECALRNKVPCHTHKQGRQLYLIFLRPLALLRETESKKKKKKQGT